MKRLNGYPRALRWSDFSHLAAPKGHLTAETYADWNWNESLLRVVFDRGRYRFYPDSVRVDVFLIDLGGTWVLHGAQNQTPEILRHEQGHFDIAGLCARDVCRHILDVEVDPALADIHAALNILKQAAGEFSHDMFKWSQKVQVLYDQQTKHRHELGQQTKWNNLLAYALATDIPLKRTLRLWGTKPPGDDEDSD